jgi:hypothetical protein
MIQTCRKDRLAKIDSQLLNDSTLTEEIRDGGEITHQKFDTKGDAGRYLYGFLNSTRLTHDDLITKKGVGLWSWLSLFFFDSVCPKDKRGEWNIKNDYTYIFDPQHRHYYRHLLFVSWRVLDITMPRGQPHRLITTTPIDSLDRVTKAIMEKLYLIRIPHIFEVLDRIYWNPNTNKVRKNITSVTREGNLTKRLPDVIKQIEVTYDLQSLNADQLIGLLGEEFDFSAR